jgi:hypothetical protein
MSEVNVLWSSAWVRLQKNLASSARLGEFSNAGLSCDAQGQHGVLAAGSWLVRARRGNVQESSLRL